MTIARNILPTVARVLLGSIFLVFGLNGFLQFLPAPEVPPDGGAFLGALAATGYMFPLIKGTEVVAAALLLINRWVPLALLLLAPVIVNIALFHLVLAPSLGMVVTLVALEAFLAWHVRGAFAPLFVGAHRRIALARATQPEEPALASA